MTQNREGRRADQVVRKDTRLGRTSQSILIWPSVAPCLCFCHPGNKKGLIGRVGIEGVLGGSLEEDFFYLKASMQAVAYSPCGSSGPIFPFPFHQPNSVQLLTLLKSPIYHHAVLLLSPQDSKNVYLQLPHMELKINKHQAPSQTLKICHHKKFVKNFPFIIFKKQLRKLEKWIQHQVILSNHYFGFFLGGLFVFLSDNGIMITQENFIGA